ncbi:MAG: YihY/virulence factor BrkB family protein [Planctomycetales bacterium]
MWEVIRRSVISYRRHRVGAHSAQFAFYSLFALVPMLVLIVAGVARLPLVGAIDNFVQTVNAGLPPSAVELIQAQIRDIQRQPALGPVVAALILLLYAGSGIFLSIGAGLDVVYEVQQRRRFVWTGLRAIALTLGGYVLLLTAVVLLVVGPMAAEFLVGRVTVPWVHVALSTGVRGVVACGAILLAASVTYWAIPSVRPRWRLVTPGTVFATTAWLLVTQGFRLWVENFGTYNEAYGTLAGVVVLLMWLYLTGSVLLIGGQIDGVIHIAAERAGRSRND